MQCLNGSLLVSSNSTCTSSNVLSFSFHNVHGHVMPISDNSKTAELCPSPNLVCCKLQDWPEKRLGHWLSISTLALAVPWEKGVHPGNVPQDPQFWHVLKAQSWFFAAAQDCLLSYSLNLPLAIFHSFNFGGVQQIPERKLVLPGSVKSFISSCFYLSLWLTAVSFCLGSARYLFIWGKIKN